MKRLLTLFLLALPVYSVHASSVELASAERATAAGVYSDSVDGFGGLLLTVLDPDWREKWATDEAVAPHFTTTDTLQVGSRVSILTFYSNPATNAAGEHRILCAVRAYRPDGTLSINENGVECAGGPLQGDPHNVRLTAAVIDFVAEASDQEGLWRIEVELTDAVRGVSVPLRTHFTLEK